VYHRNDDHLFGCQPVGDEVRVVRDNNFSGSGAATGMSQQGEVAQILRGPYYFVRNLSRGCRIFCSDIFFDLQYVLG